MLRTCVYGVIPFIAAFLLLVGSFHSQRYVARSSVEACVTAGRCGMVDASASAAEDFFEDFEDLMLLQQNIQRVRRSNAARGDMLMQSEPVSLHTSANESYHARALPERTSKRGKQFRMPSKVQAANALKWARSKKAKQKADQATDRAYDIIREREIMKNRPGGVAKKYVAALICFMGSCLCVIGLTLQKEAHSDTEHHPKFGDMIISPMWLLGLALTIVAPSVADLLAYSLAPMSFTAPLSGFTLLNNLIVAPLARGEGVQAWPDLPATLITVIGMALTSMLSAKNDPNYTLEDLLMLAQKPAWICGLAILTCLIVACIVYMVLHASEIKAEASASEAGLLLGRALLPAFVASGFGLITNIMLKGLGEIMTTGSSWVVLIAWGLLGVAPPATLQLNYMNRGLSLYPQLVFVPTYSALLVIMNTCGALLYYEEYKVFEHRIMQCIFFIVGLLMIAGGLGLLCFRKPQGSATRLSEMPESIWEKVRIWTSALLLFISYVVMLPGIFGAHFEFSFGLRSIWDSLRAQHAATHSLELGIYKITKLLLQSEDGQPVPSLIGGCIFVWGVVLPFLKLGVLISYTFNLLKSTLAISIVQRLSKWAMVDVFIPMLWVALCNRPSVLTKQDLTFFPNYTLFAVHVLLNMFGVLLFKFPATALSSLPKESTSTRHWIHIVLLCTFVIFAFMAALPMGILQVMTREDLVFTDSISSVVSSLWSQGYIAMAGSVLLFGIIFPAIDYPLTAATWLGLQVNSHARTFFHAFAMFDVLMVAVLCTRMTMIVLKGYLKMEIKEGGVLLMAVTFSWYLATLASGSQPASARPHVPAVNVPALTRLPPEISRSSRSEPNLWRA